jgi:hypothetical protein
MYCFTCSPPQIHGTTRKDGLVAGTGELETAGKVRGRMRMNMYAGGKIDKDRIPSEASPIPHRSLDAAVREMEVAMNQERAGVEPSKEGEIKKKRGRPPKVRDVGSGGQTAEATLVAGAVMKNAGGDDVLAYQRPDLGWGKCKHIDPVEKREVCIKERWSGTAPFCREHVQFWVDKREENKARKIMDEEVSQFQDLSKENFFFKNAQDVMDFLSRVNFAVYKNWIPIGKARALSAIARVQIKALDSKIIAHRLHAIISGLNKGDGGSSITTPDDLEEMEEDIERAKMMGLAEMASLVSDRMPQKEGRRVEFQPGEHPDLTPPDPEFPVHNEDSQPTQNSLKAPFVFPVAPIPPPKDPMP